MIWKCPIRREMAKKIGDSRQFSVVTAVPLPFHHSSLINIKKAIAIPNLTAVKEWFQKGAHPPPPSNLLLLFLQFFCSGIVTGGGQRWDGNLGRSRLGSLPPVGPDGLEIQNGTSTRPGLLRLKLFRIKGRKRSSWFHCIFTVAFLIF